jgi:hypothetical protein
MGFSFGWYGFIIPWIGGIVKGWGIEKAPRAGLSTMKNEY